MHIPNGAVIGFGLSSITVLPRIRTLFSFTLLVLQHDDVSIVSKRWDFFNCARGCELLAPERVDGADYVDYVGLFAQLEYINT